MSSQELQEALTEHFRRIGMGNACQLADIALYELAAQPDSLREKLTFAEFARVNRLRCESREGFDHALDSWSTSDWFTALFGELGEAANVAKKLNRIRDSVGVKANRGVEAEELRTKLRQELGDGYVYLDLLAQSLGFLIGDAAVEVFNAKSKELGCPIALASPTPPAVTPPVEARAEQAKVSPQSEKEQHARR
jgi:hypothetical protein